MEGGTPRPLWPGARGRWTKDGRYFVFQRAGRRPAAISMRCGRVASVRLAAVARAPDVGPVSFSDVGPAPGGSRLLAWGTTNGASSCGSTRRRRFDPYLGGAIRLCRSSSDGQWLAWVSCPDGGLWSSRPDGTERLKLTPAGFLAVLPRWSPDDSLVFAGSAHRGGAAQRLCRLGRRRRAGVAGTAAVGDRPHIWDVLLAPRRTHRRVLPPGSGGGDLPPRCALAARLDGRSRGLLFPKCSRQGAVLAFERPVKGQSSATAKVAWDESGGWESLGSLNLSYPNWTADGRSIIGLDVSSRTIVRFTPATRRFETLADLGDIPLAPTTEPWMGLAPDDSPLVLATAARATSTPSTGRRRSSARCLHRL